MKKVVAITALIALAVSLSATQASASGGGFCRSMGRGMPVCQR
jgi:hypothetical protein